MKEKVKIFFKRMAKWTIVFSLPMTIYLGIRFYLIGYLPQDNFGFFPFFSDSIKISRWWDILVGPLLFLSFIFIKKIFEKIFEPDDIKDNIIMFAINVPFLVPALVFIVITCFMGSIISGLFFLFTLSFLFNIITRPIVILANFLK